MERCDFEMSSRRERRTRLHLPAVFAMTLAMSALAVAEEPSVEGEPAKATEGQREDPLAALSSASFPRSVPLFGSKFRVGFGGYVKLDAIADLSGHPDPYGFTIQNIPLTGTDEALPDGYVSIHARETRLHFESRFMGEDAPPNQAYIEIDFYTPALSDFASPRLRHAYLRWGPITAGQTWSLLTDSRAIPFIIDFAHADAVNSSRVPQLRWQDKLAPWLTARFGIEMPETTGIGNPNQQAGSTSPRFPRLAGGVSLDAERGFVSVGASMTELRWDSYSDTAANPTALGWAFVLNSRVFLDPAKRFFLGGHAMAGAGSALSVGVFSAANANATLLADGSLRAIPTAHAVLGLGARWSSVFSSNGLISWDRLVAGDEDPDLIVEGWSLHVNSVIHVSEFLQTGLEFMAGGRETADGRTGTAQRLQGMVMYSF